MKEKPASAGKMDKSGENEIAIASEELLSSIRPLIEQARARVAQFCELRAGHALLADRQTYQRGFARREPGWVWGESCRAGEQEADCGVREGLSTQQCVSHDPFCRGLPRCQDSPDTVWTVVVVPFHRNHLMPPTRARWSSICVGWTDTSAGRVRSRPLA
jgi:hypothetical protein